MGGEVGWWEGGGVEGDEGLGGGGGSWVVGGGGGEGDEGLGWGVKLGGRGMMGRGRKKCRPVPNVL